jgi:hypothetical protein
LQGLRLLSAGADRAFRCFSTIQDQQSRELSQKNIKTRAKRLKLAESELRLAPIVQLAACQVGQGARGLRAQVQSQALSGQGGVCGVERSGP